jgi:hypothetical protein
MISGAQETFGLAEQSAHNRSYLFNGSWTLGPYSSASSRADNGCEECAGSVCQGRSGALQEDFFWEGSTYLEVK